jgi:multicomponent Na+:H+ antiporter subunit A
MLIAVLSGFLLAGSLLLTGKLVRTKGSLLLSLLPLTLFLYFLSYLNPVASGQAQHFRYNWIPSAIWRFILTGFHYYFHC